MRLPPLRNHHPNWSQILAEGGRPTFFQLTSPTFLSTGVLDFCPSWSSCPWKLTRKTIWSRDGCEKRREERLGRKPGTPPEQRGLTVLGAPLGTPEYQRHHLSQTRASHQALLDEIPSLDDLQASWLLLLYCASPRCNYLLRMLPPTTTRQYAQDHDLAVLSCLTTLLDAANMPATAVALAHLPLHLGGLGLTSATITAAPAYWASWADTLPILYRQAPQQATTLLQQLEAETPATPSIHALTQAMDQLQRHGFEPPSWADLVQGRAPPTQPDPEQRLLGRGWQRPAALASHQAFRADLTASLDPASQAMLQSQSGPYASRTFTTIPFGLDTTYPSHLFRVLLLRRLRPPTASVSPHLSVPSHFRPIRRPSRSMCPGRGFTGTRDSLGKGSSQSLPGSWGQGNHPHPPQRSQPGPHQPARWQKDRGYSQWTPILGGSATRGRHHPGISFDFLQPAPKTRRPIRRSSAPGCTQIQGAHIPRTSPFQEVQARGPRHRNRGPVEPGSNNFPPPLGPDKSQSSSQHPSQSCWGFPPLTLVSHPHPCSPTCLRGQSPGLRLRR